MNDSSEKNFYYYNKCKKNKNKDNQFSKKFNRLLSLENYCDIHFGNQFISEQYPNKNIMFSANTETSNYHFLNNQLNSNDLILSIPTLKQLKIIDTKDGGIYLHGNKLVFILIPRFEILNNERNNSYINSLMKIESVEKNINQIEDFLIKYILKQKVVIILTLELEHVEERRDYI